jgi:hypothetical protein
MPDGLKRYYGRGDLHFMFYDFNVYSPGKVKEKLNYIHANPVIRKLVKHPKDWPWSSWSEYMRDEPGLIVIDAVL